MGKISDSRFQISNSAGSAGQTSAQSEIVIIGTGAMACLFGARLSPLANVTLIGAWAKGVQALQKNGIRLAQGETETTIPVRAQSKPTGIQADVALILVKSYQTERAAQWAAQSLKPAGIALTLQNGLGNLEKLAEAVGPARAALGVSMQGATLVGPGHVRHGGNGPTTLAATPATKARLPFKSMLSMAASLAGIASLSRPRTPSRFV